MYDLIATKLRKCKHDITSRLPVSCGIIEIERLI